LGIDNGNKYCYTASTVQQHMHLLHYTISSSFQSIRCDYPHDRT
jgi:hypothetical protein